MGPALVLYSAPVVSLTCTVFLYSAFLPLLQLLVTTPGNGEAAGNTNNNGRTKIRKSSRGYSPNTVEAVLRSDHISNSFIVSKIAKYNRKSKPFLSRLWLSRGVLHRKSFCVLHETLRCYAGVLAARRIIGGDPDRTKKTRHLSDAVVGVVTNDMRVGA